MKTTKFIYLYLFGLFFSVNGFCQEMNSFLKEFITVDDGLPTNEVYQVIQSSDHFLWFATDNGLVRYDGENFSVFNTSNGLPSNEVFRLMEMRDGRIYGECSNTKLFCIDGTQVINLPVNKILHQYLSGFSRCYSFYLDEKFQLHVGSKDGYFVFNADGQLIEKDFVQYDTQKKYGTFKYKILDDFVVSYHINDITQSYCIQNADPPFELIPLKNYRLTGDAQYTEKINDSTFVILLENHVLIIQSGEIFDSISTNSKSIGLKYIDSVLWIGTANEGVFAYELVNNAFLLKDHFLDGYSVTSILKDNVNGFWFSTREAGIVHISNFNVEETICASEEQNISSYYENDRLKAIGFEDGMLMFFSDDTLKFKLPNPIIGIHEVNKTIFIFSAGKTYNLDEQKGRLVEIVIQSDGQTEVCHDIASINDSLCVVHNMSTWFVYNLISHEVVFKKPRYPSMPRLHEFYVHNNKLFAATGTGVDTYDAENFSLLHQYDLNAQVSSLFFHGDTVFATCQNGEVFLLQHEAINVGLFQNNLVNSILDACTSDDKIYLATNLGVYIYEWVPEKKNWFFRETINIKQVKNIGVSDGKIIFTTKKKVYHYIPSTEKPHPPVLLPGNFRVDGTNQNITSNPIFPYNKNSISIDLMVISFSRNDYFLKYKMEGLENKYQYTSEKQFNYYSLNPGDYSFRVSASSNGVDFSEEISIPFTIDKPFWLKTWFIILITISVVLLFVFIFYRQKRRLQQKHAISKRIAELRSQALTNQLNPHLVFNILNSIQSLILKGEIELANKYLVRFSRFLRQSLKASKTLTINLEEEIRITEIYLSLEMLRFGSGLKVNILNKASFQKFQVPPLIIQPFIENAIKHGIMPTLRKDGEISILISGDEKKIEIIIEDNGKGYEETHAAKNRDGIRISKERLEVLNPLNQIVVEGRPGQTRVTINILA